MTGAAGFIGSHALRALRARSHEPIGFARTRPGPGRIADLTDGVEFVDVDLTDPAAVRRAIFDTAPDAVIHAAWYAEPRLYLHDVERNIESLQSGLTLLRTALDAGVPRIVLVGTCLEGVHGNTESIYATTKGCLHDLALAPAIRARSVVTCAHVFSPYGPGEHPDRIVPTIIRSLLQGESIAVGSGEPHRDFVHVSDVAVALSVLAEASVGGSADICSGQSRPLRDIFAAIAAEVERPELIQWGQAVIGSSETFDVHGDPSELRALGWTPTFGLADGIRDAIAWWRSQLATTRGTH